MTPSSRFYRLEGHEPVREANFMRWAMSRGDGLQWSVARTEFPGRDLFVSTIYTGVDRRFMDEGPPILFETMVFNRVEPLFQRHYCTWDEAEAGHAACVAEIERRIVNCNH